MPTLRHNLVRICEVETRKGRVMIPFELHRSTRARQMKVLVNEDELVMLTLPRCVPEAHGIEFLKSQGDWLMEVIGKRPRRVTLIEHLQKKPWVSAFGMRHDVTTRFCCLRPRWEYDGEKRSLLVYYDPNEPQREQLILMLREFARMAIRDRVEFWSRRHGLEPGRVTIRDQRTRWGSCTSQANLSFNWRLILLPPSLQDHVILHELAHLTHLDHSKRFWSLLREYDRDADDHHEALNRLSPTIMRLGR